jgi:hypothetical protein
VEQKTGERNVAVPTGVSDTRDNPPEASTLEKTEHRILGAGFSIEFVSVAALIPDTANDVPRDVALHPAFLREVKSGLRTATGAQEKDISIRIAKLPTSVLIDAVPAANPPTPVTGYRVEGATAGLVLLGLVALLGAYRLVRGLAPAESNVVAEESLRAPGESILSAQDEALDRIRDGVRQSVTRNPREAADVARRWMSP